MSHHYDRQDTVGLMITDALATCDNRSAETVDGLLWRYQMLFSAVRRNDLEG
jgi:hypothetical protein